MTGAMIQTIMLRGLPTRVVRSDLNHPVVQGNKLWKLKYHLIEAQKRSVKTLVTFGGAYSNHLVAMAYAASESGLASIGVVRGDELAMCPERWSHTLREAEAHGMVLHFVSRSDYRLKTNSEQVKLLLSSLDNPVVVPEGGSGPLAIKGVAEYIAEILETLVELPTHIFCPVGTGATLAGLIQAVDHLLWDCQILGVPVLKGLHGVKDDINQWLDEDEKLCRWLLLDQYHFGGYAKSTNHLRDFAIEFQQKYHIPLDKVYNAKSFYALNDWIKEGHISADDRPLVIHTGGLQGGVFGENDEFSN